MTRWWAIFRREVAASAQSPSLCIFAALFFVLVGVIFNGWLGIFAAAAQGDARALADVGDQPLNANDFLARNLFGIILNLLILVVPLMTMRLVSEERKLGTYDLLMSYPLREVDVVVGKFFAAWAMVLAMLALSAMYPLIIAWASGWRLEIGPIFASYLGLAVVTAAFVAVGLLASCLTENQLVAGLLALGALLLSYFLGNLAPLDSGALARLMRALDTYEHSDWFLRGVIRAGDVTHFLVLTVAALYLAQRALAFRRAGVLR